MPHNPIREQKYLGSQVPKIAQSLQSSALKDLCFQMCTSVVDGTHMCPVGVIYVHPCLLY